MNKEVNDNLNENTSQEDIEFLTTAVPIIKDLNDEQIEMLTTSLPVIKDYTEEEINELIKNEAFSESHTEFFELCLDYLKLK